MSDCEEKIYSNDYVDFIISKDVLDVIDLSSDCIQRIDEEKDTYFYPRSFFGYLIFRQIPMLLFQSAMDFWMRRRLRFRGY